MTREEAYTLGEKIKVPSMEQRTIRIREFIDIVYNEFEKRNVELEQRIAELQKSKTCDGCSYEKQSSPLFIHCLGCSRAKHLKDKFHDINEPCKG